MVSPVGSVAIAHIDGIVRSSLRSLVTEVFSGDWQGRERELISLFAFGYLLVHVGRNPFLQDATQIGIEVAVPQLAGPNRKSQVCKDLVLWPRPRMTCWDKSRQPVRHPATILEWKVDRTTVSARDVAWLREYSTTREQFVGFAVCVDRHARKFKLRCDRVEQGDLQSKWLEL